MGGDSFVMVDARSIGFEIVPAEARDIVETGMRITRAANEQLGFRHPENGWDHISFCQLTKPVTEGDDGSLVGVNTVMLQPGKLDRSPTGTGCSARLAVLHARGQIAPKQRLLARSIIGTEFSCYIDEVVSLAGKPAVRPVVSGRAWIHSLIQHVLDPEDPFPAGYRIADSWPMIR